MAKKFAKKIATYAMAATMIGGAVIGSGSTGVFAAEKYPQITKNHMKITRRHMKIS